MLNPVNLRVHRIILTGLVVSRRGWFNRSRFIFINLMNKHAHTYLCSCACYISSWVFPKKIQTDELRKIIEVDHQLNLPQFAAGRQSYKTSIHSGS